MTFSIFDDFTTRQINRYMRANDTSNLWPINGKFNATDRAIRRLSKGDAARAGGQIYMRALDQEINNVVNNVSS